MIGAILGDIIGSPYEFDMYNIKTKDFPLFKEESNFTDDTVMTIAVAEGLLKGYGDLDKTKEAIIDSMHKYGDEYPDAGYGGNFGMWLYLKDRKPYNSFGNGSAMRVAAVGWLYDTIEQVDAFARASAEVTHNHPEGIKGAQATAVAIFMARKGENKETIKQVITEKYGYDLERTCDEIRPNYKHVESCQQTVPEAIIAFIEGESFEDVIRTAVSLGGDCDTLTAIAGSIAEAYYGVPESLREECFNRIPGKFRDVVENLKAFCKDRELMSLRP